jgi:hypothetical protein
VFTNGVSLVGALHQWCFVGGSSPVSFNLSPTTNQAVPETVSTSTVAKLSTGHAEAKVFVNYGIVVSFHDVKAARFFPIVESTLLDVYQQVDSRDQMGLVVRPKGVMFWKRESEAVLLKWTPDDT